MSRWVKRYEMIRLEGWLHFLNEHDFNRDRHCRSLCPRPEKRVS